MPGICEKCTKDNARYLIIENGKQISICAECSKNIKQIGIIMDNPHFWTENGGN